MEEKPCTRTRERQGKVEGKDPNQALVHIIFPQEQLKAQIWNRVVQGKHCRIINEYDIYAALDLRDSTSPSPLVSGYRHFRPKKIWKICLS